MPRRRSYAESVRRIKLLPDLTPFRASRNLRLVVGGNFVSNMGAQATLVALPYQLYVLTHSAFLVGLLGAAELGPLVFMSLVGGAVADRTDRRRLLLLTQIGVVTCAGGLAIVSFAGHPLLASAVRARRAAGRLQRAAERGAVGGAARAGDRPRTAGAGDRAQLRAVDADDGARARVSAGS